MTNAQASNTGLLTVIAIGVTVIAAAVVVWLVQGAANAWHAAAAQAELDREHEIKAAKLADLKQLEHAAFEVVHGLHTSGRRGPLTAEQLKEFEQRIEVTDRSGNRVRIEPFTLAPEVGFVLRFPGPDQTYGTDDDLVHHGTY